MLCIHRPIDEHQRAKWTHYPIEIEYYYLSISMHYPQNK